MRVGRHDVGITNPDKLFFPEQGLTKGDLVDYYLAVASCALPHLRRRPFHMKRYPNGVEGDFFHQKRVPAHPDFVGEQFVRFPSGHSTVFAVIDNAAALAWVINLGCIELHTWHSRVDDIERPDYMLIDLDPTTNDQWEHVLVIALVVKEVLDELGLPSYPKTSGSTGLHTERCRRSWSTYFSRGSLGLHEPEPEMVRARADLALAARPDHVARTELIGAEKRSAAVDAFLRAGLGRIE